MNEVWGTFPFLNEWKNVSSTFLGDTLSVPESTVPIEKL